MESSWNSNGNCSRRLLDSDHFHQIPSDSVEISMELETRMAEAPAICIPSEFHGILTFHLDSAGTHGGW